VATETSDNGVGSGQGKILATVCVGHIWKPDLTVFALLKAKQNQSIWSDVYYYFHFQPLVSFLVGAVILLGIPFLIGVSLCRTNLPRPWRSIIGLSMPFFPAYLVKALFFSMTNFKDILRREKEE